MVQTMTDGELLSAISAIFEPIRQDLKEIKAEICGVQSDVPGMKADTHTMIETLQRIEDSMQESVEILDRIEARL